MSRTLTLHIGTPKSGTTHLQAVLHRAREELDRRGILYPGAGYLPHDGFNQQPAVYALAGPTIAWVDQATRNLARPYLDRLCDEVRAHPGRVLVSAESLTLFRPAEAELLLERLGFSPPEVTVVITARDLGRILPSVWQQNVKNGSVSPLERYLDSVAGLRGGSTSAFWATFGLPDLVHRWSRLVGRHRVVLVTAPPPGTDRRLLWSRYAQAASLPPTLETEFPTRVRAQDNVSLTRSQAELLRQVNRVLQSDGYDRASQQQLRSRLLQTWMNLPVRRDTPRLTLPAHLRREVVAWAREDHRSLQRTGVRVVGSLDDLIPGSGGPEGEGSADVPPAAATATATVTPEPPDLELVRSVVAFVEHGPTAGAKRSLRASAARRWRAWWAGQPGTTVGRPSSH